MQPYSLYKTQAGQKQLEIEANALSEIQFSRFKTFGKELLFQIKKIATKCISFDCASKGKKISFNARPQFSMNTTEKLLRERK